MISEGEGHRSVLMDEPFQREAKRVETSVSESGGCGLESPCLGQQCLRRPGKTGTRLSNDGATKDRIRRHS